MSSELIRLYISEQLVEFYYGPKCCMKFYALSFNFEKTIKEFDLRLRKCSNGQDIVYKKTCHHIIGDEFMCINMCTESIKDMFIYHRGSEYSGSQQDMINSGDFLGPGNSSPTLPPHRFSLGPLKQSMARPNALGHESFQKDCPMQLYKERVLASLERNRVLIIDGPSLLDKSAAVPMYIIEKYSVNKKHCKIICVERAQLLAIYNSERLANHFREKVGETVAFQVQLQSRISDSSNLIYTTSSFLLRVLMGQSITDSFRHISHIIVDDVHLYETYSILLLRELKQALTMHPYLKIILLSNSKRNNEFIKYFGEGEEVRLNGDDDPLGTLNSSLYKRIILYIDNIRNILPKSKLLSKISRAFNYLPISKNDAVLNHEYLDKCLENYERTTLEQYFDLFLYMVLGESAPINYRHSRTGRTIIIIACILGKENHVKILLQFNANPYVCDVNDMDAMKAALATSHKGCLELLKNAFRESSVNINETRKDYIDLYTILDIIEMVITDEDWQITGNILVFLPSYELLIRLNYAILKQKLIANLSHEIAVYILHNDSEKTQLDAILNSSNNVIKIILTTDIAENLICSYNAEYIIDAARDRHLIYNSVAQCNEVVYEWSSKQSMENRMLLLGKFSRGVCFRLIPSFLYDTLPEQSEPEILTMPLDRVCLSVKLLSQHSMVSEYLQETIVKPPFINVFRTVDYLKQINVFNEFEDITWLGCRLIDVPVECSLGRLLVFGILLQCLDPVLTMVSFMSTVDPFDITHYNDELIEPYKGLVNNKIHEEKKRLSQGFFSDHLLYVRLYQEWQNDLKDDNIDDIANEYNFVLNGLLEYVCGFRTQLVGALRSSQLIHNKGNLSMHFINLKSNCWPIIKAALVGGLYPNIGILDTNDGRIKAKHQREMALSPNSVLREVKIDSLKKFDFVSPWVVHGKITNSWKCNSIDWNTLVSPISAALFAGKMKMSASNIEMISNTGPENDASPCLFHVDDMFSFRTNITTAMLLLKTRQQFYSIYSNYLQHCGQAEKYKRFNIAPMCLNVNFFDCLQKVLTQEDVTCGFLQPERIGLRPKAIPNKFIMGPNGIIPRMDINRALIFSNVAWSSRFQNQLNYKSLEKQYFMVYSTEFAQLNSMASNPSTDGFYELSRMLRSKLGKDKISFIIFYSRNPDCLKSISISEWCPDLKLNECFKFNISMASICNILTPYFNYINQKKTAFKIDDDLGELILNMFAYRNNWLHTNYC